MAVERPAMDEAGEPDTRQDSRTDQELICAINEGDALAFEILYYRYRDWVTSLAFRFTNDRELALDVMQETFLYFIKKVPGFRLTANFKTFLYPAIKHLSIAARRQSQRFQSSEAELEQLEVSAASAPVIAELEPLQAALVILSTEHREVLTLRFVDGFSLNEIAEALSIPLGTVKSRLHIALKTLREDNGAKKYFER